MRKSSKGAAPVASRLHKIELSMFSMINGGKGWTCTGRWTLGGTADEHKKVLEP